MNLNSMGFNNGTITLDEPLDIYYSGQVLSGKIVFELDKPLQFSAIKVAYNGEANVNWTEQQVEMYSGVKTYKDVVYKGYELYFNVVQCVSEGTGINVLPAGQHSIPFAFQIPYNVPSSFDGDKGNITYKITASVELPPTFIQQLVKTFEVVAPMDLNKDTTGDVKRPIEMEFEEFYSCCCSSQPITMKIKLPVSGYCPGQSLPITIDAQNHSNTEISKIIFHLVMRERHHSRDPVSEYIPPEKVIATMKKGPILAKTKRVYLCDMPVPEFIAPNLENCNIIDIGYFFKVTIKLSGCNNDLHNESEIYIGMIPLEISTGGAPYIHPMIHSLPKAPLPDPNLAPTSFPPSYMSGEGPIQYNANINNLNTMNHSPYGSKNSINVNIPLIDARSSPNLPYPTPTAPYPIEGKPEPYEIGFKI
ncbi:arrestin domain-containing protein 2-like [Battus philenor]|uniref:arrestin domain-containing protein 2-like n=1 Tax=Battus philenor TaxID=42288 RepID=UPI0035CF776D